MLAAYSSNKRGKTWPGLSTSVLGQDAVNKVKRTLDAVDHANGNNLHADKEAELENCLPQRHEMKQLPSHPSPTPLVTPVPSQGHPGLLHARVMMARLLPGRSGMEVRSHCCGQKPPEVGARVARLSEGFGLILRVFKKIYFCPCYRSGLETCC